MLQGRGWEWPVRDKRLEILGLLTSAVGRTLEMGLAIFSPEKAENVSLQLPS
jgi:hypothetical protein